MTAPAQKPTWLDESVVARKTDHSEMPRRARWRFIGIDPLITDDPVNKETVFEFTSLGGGGGITPTGTGFPHVTGGALDPVARAVALDTADITGTLQIAHGGTGLTGVGAANSVLTSTGAALAYATSLVLAGLTLTGLAGGGTQMVTVSNTGVVGAQAITSGPTWATDLAGSTNTSQIVVALTGASSTLEIRSTAAALQWDAATASPVLRHQSQTSDVATSALTIAAQNAWTSATTNIAGGNLVLAAGASAPSDPGSNNGQVYILCHGATGQGLRLKMDSTNSSKAAGLWIDPRLGNVTVADQGGARIAVEDASTWSGTVGMPLTLRGGKSVTTSEGGHGRLYGGDSGTTGSFPGRAILGDEYHGDIVAVGGKPSGNLVDYGLCVAGVGGANPNSVGAYSHTYSAHTTSTTANQTLATIDLTELANTGAGAGALLNVTVIVSGKTASSGASTDWASYSQSWSFYFENGTLYSGAGTQPSATYLNGTTTAGSAAAIKLTASGTSVLVQGTPWTASGVDWGTVAQVTVRR